MVEIRRFGDKRKPYLDVTAYCAEDDGGATSIIELSAQMCII
jgi:hypothetical protein